MSNSNRARARKIRLKRNEARRKRNLERVLALTDVADQDATPKLERARHMTQLSFLLGRGSISDDQYKAGDRFYRDWRASGSEPRIVPSYDRTIGLGSDGSALEQVAARWRFERALRHVGKQLRAPVVAVCLLDQPPAEWAKLANKPPIDGLPLLRAGLDALDDFYERAMSRMRGEREKLSA